jgi:hypothetical protein
MITVSGLSVSGGIASKGAVPFFHANFLGQTLIFQKNISQHVIHSRFS